ncbi:uncharacterized protein SPSK_03425 [Sporothrix schenckii 1099-18]|uniref:F-box domain-containing protein n=1 Tax=Sporothrix schenckii 1099-18 TaxID=1397361 RepID=A0A0F2LWW2_SPOSC|nr:uncharacterized protein SPSK_03425 [Sporothrix schenckii 1099-18]KJR81938.1 hypothetical protein SPSK_03425 [Sporothrix schenckii 1099-18]
MAFDQDSTASAAMPPSGQPMQPLQQPRHQERREDEGKQQQRSSQKPPPASIIGLPPPTTKSPPPVNSLPPELLDDVLNFFPTSALLKFAGVNRRFHNVVARLLYRRLRHAVALANHQLILACYHPSAKISSPHLNCAYLGTEGLDLPCPESGADNGPEDTLRRLPTMYSRFRPVPPSASDVHVRNYRAIRRTMNFFLLSDTTSGGTAATALQTVKEGTAGAASGPPLVCYDVHLDEGELFSQLCTVTNLVKTSGQPGMFLNCVNINDGVIRVWRDWLDTRATATTAAEGAASASASASTKTASQKPPSIADTSQHVLWAYTGKHVGMRFRVTERAVPANRLVTAAQLDNERFRRATMPPEEPPVSFVLEYEELLVRTYELLLAMEAVEAQDASHGMRGVVMSSL